MSKTILHEALTLRQQAAALTSGFALILFLGIGAAIALALVAMWLLAQLALLIIQSIAECSAAIGATFTSADPLTRLLILVLLAYGVYRAGRVLLRKRGTK